MVLKVPFTGASGIRVTWRFQGRVISSGGRYKIVTTSSNSILTVDNFQESDCGTYEVCKALKPTLLFRVKAVEI